MSPISESIIPISTQTRGSPRRHFVASTIDKHTQEHCETDKGINQKALNRVFTMMSENFSGGTKSKRRLCTGKSQRSKLNHASSVERTPNKWLKEDMKQIIRTPSELGSQAAVMHEDAISRAENFRKFSLHNPNHHHKGEAAVF